MTRSLLLAVVVALAASCGAASRAPCAVYFTSSRSGSEIGPIRWLSGAWEGSSREAEGAESKPADMVWMPLRGATMLGMLRTRHRDGAGDTADTRFFSIRQQADGGLVLVVHSDTGAPLELPAVEGGEGFVVFENAENEFPTRVSYRYDASLKIRMDGKNDRQELLIFWRKV